MKRVGSAMCTQSRTRPSGRTSTARASSISRVVASSMANAGRCVRSRRASASASGGGDDASAAAAASSAGGKSVGTRRRTTSRFWCACQVPVSTRTARAASAVRFRPSRWRNACADATSAPPSLAAAVASSGPRSARQPRRSRARNAPRTSSSSSSSTRPVPAVAILSRSVCHLASISASATALARSAATTSAGRASKAFSIFADGRKHALSAPSVSMARAP
mmetsp:Transcript_4859/g.10296  ORF Transcript_4859/g.10296 Transcript_4859/m.10296 type:complete len:222 (+) Transcript_4859:891-1556(+)